MLILCYLSSASCVIYSNIHFTDPKLQQATMIAAPQSFGMNSSPIQTADELIPARVDHVWNASRVPSFLDIYSSRTFKKPRSLKKSVRFSEIVQVTYLDQPTQDDIKASWYQKEDIERVKYGNKVCVAAFQKVGRKASRLPRDKYCIRGLETLLTKSICLNSKCERKHCISAVLVAQQQCDPGSSLMAEKLRMVSLLSSVDMVQDAIKKASKDAMIWREEYLQFM